jgi:hypothetical protein
MILLIQMKLSAAFRKVILNPYDAFIEFEKYKIRHLFINHSTYSI